VKKYIGIFDKYKLVILLFSWVCLMFLVSKLSNNFILDRTSYEVPAGIVITDRSFFLPWLNFDGRNYLDISIYGYFQKGIYNLRSFFPLYPLTISAFSIVTKINHVYSGLLISVISLIGSVIFLKRLLKKEYDEVIAFKTILTLLLFPTSFFFMGFYSESLYFFLTIIFFWFLGKRDFVLATVFAMLASGTKIVGLTLFPIILIEAIRNFNKTKKFPLVILLSPLGFVFYCIYSLKTTGDAFIFLHSWFSWEKTFSVFGPIKSALNGFINVLNGPQTFFDSPFVYPVAVLELLSLIFILITLVISFRKIKFIYWFYILINSYVFLSGGILQSLPRYLLVLFPIHLFYAKYLSKKAFVVYNLISFLMLLIFTAIFLRGYWVS
jgi:Gpi18-like mannosyltransferase